MFFFVHFDDGEVLVGQQDIQNRVVHRLGGRAVSIHTGFDTLERS